MTAARVRWTLFVAILTALAGCEAEEPLVRPVEGQADVDTDASSAADADLEVLPDATAAAVLADLFDMDEIRSAEALNLQVKAANVKTMTDPAGVVLVPFSFRSQIWHGNQWTHPAVLYLPAAIPAHLAGTLVVMQQGTPDLAPGTDVNIDTDFGARSAAALGVPVLVLGQVPDDTIFQTKESPTLGEAHPLCFERLLQSADLDDCAAQLTLTSGKTKWSITVAMARAYMRAITAVEHLGAALVDAEAEGVPPFTVERVITAGAGSRGRAQWLVAAVDDRVDGVWVAASDAGNLPAFYDLVSRAFSKSSEKAEAAAWIEVFEGPLRDWWRSMEDVAVLAEHFQDKAVMVVRGTDDPQFPVGATALYADSLPPDTSFAVVVDYGHGVATSQHLLAFRTFVASVFAGRPRIVVDAAWTSTGLWQYRVEATLDATGAPAPQVVSVDAWYTSDADVDDGDLRDAVWSSVPLVSQGTDAKGRAVYVGEFTTLLDAWGAFVEVRETRDGVDGVATTPLHGGGGPGSASR